MLLQNRQCNLCQKKTLKLIKTKLRDGSTKHKVYRCLSCSHVQLSPLPTLEEDKTYYDQNQQDISAGKKIDIEKLRQNNMFDSLRHVSLIKKIARKNQKILDIGAGYGFFLDELYKKGFKDTIGLEVSEERRSKALKITKVPILDIDINNSKHNLELFDIVTLFHVLEHMPDPVAFAKNIYKILKPKGFLVCEVPNVDELLLQSCTAYNDFYWIRAHLNYFNEKTLTSVLKKAGFNDVKIKYQQRYGVLNMSNWLMYGNPQLEAPLFDIHKEYEFLDKAYKYYLEQERKSDALIAIATV